MAIFYDWDIKDTTSVLVVKRERIEESGKIPVRYALWRDRETGKTYFGIASSDFTQTIGLPIDKNKEKIEKFLDEVIERGRLSYRIVYLPAPPEQITERAILQEIVPPFEEDKPLDEEMREQFILAKEKLKEIVE